MTYREVPGDEALNELLQGKQVALTENANAWHQLINGVPYLIDKHGNIQPLFGNSDAYKRFIENLIPTVVWYVKE